MYIGQTKDPSLPCCVALEEVAQKLASSTVHKIVVIMLQEDQNQQYLEQILEISCSKLLHRRCIATKPPNCASSKSWHLPISRTIY
jgi:hypothetical protein